MMKKLILIPTILASATPLVCMVACNPSKPVMSITGGEQKQVVARERRIGDKNAIVATFPGFTAKNVTLSNLTLEVKTDA
ncbi:MAG: hypothetical protein MJ233_05280 [Mycoplasmoidaceae bacterium]|nr:hypothetical protein [Mycoplasmoidaceae bacterium]